MAKSRCAYTESNKRCRRNGSGNPSLCDAHRIVLEAELARPQRPGEKLVGLIGRFVRGERVTDQNIYAGIEDLVGLFERHPYANAGPWRTDPKVRRARQAPPPPPRKPALPDPRIVLGFAAGQKVTADEVKKRHRELARKHHPDRGGSLARMQEINAAVDQLLATL